MIKCHVCGSTAVKNEFVSEVCERCGDPAFSRETTKKIRRLIHGESRPSKTVPFDVFALA